VKEIELTNGRVAFVDDEDFDRINQYRWYWKQGHGTISGYALRMSSARHGRRRELRMHKEVLGLSGDQIADHINGNGLDNRKENLRICSKAENARNVPKYRNNSSGFKGVSWCHEQKKWRAIIGVNGRLVHLGRFTTKEDAARAYNEAAKKHFGEFARLNNV